MTPSLKHSFISFAITSFMSLLAAVGTASAVAEGKPTTAWLALVAMHLSFVGVVMNAWDLVKELSNPAESDARFILKEPKK